MQTLFTKQVTLMRRPNVLSLPLQLGIRERLHELASLRDPGIDKEQLSSFDENVTLSQLP